MSSISGPLTSVIDTKPNRERKAYHDAGHALAALLTPGGPRVDEVTLEVHRKSRHGFVSAFVPSEKQRTYADFVGHYRATNAHSCRHRRRRCCR